MDDYGFERILKIVVKNLQSGIFFFLFSIPNPMTCCQGRIRQSRPYEKYFFIGKKSILKFRGKNQPPPLTLPGFRPKLWVRLEQVRFGQVRLTRKIIFFPLLPVRNFKDHWRFSRTTYPVLLFALLLCTVKVIIS